MKPRVLSGMRPTGKLHLGNYFGALKQFLELQQAGDECYFFVADIHSLTRLTERKPIQAMSMEVARTYVACGLDPSVVTIYRQSDVPEISEIATILGNFVTIGKLRLCTTFKEELRKTGLEESHATFGLLGYPILMAADILSVKANKVPVGRDQTQHVEMTREFARAFNRIFKTDTFMIPEMNVMDPITVRGLDGGEKMGKTDGNTINLLDDPEQILRKVKSIPTQADAGGPMQSGTAALFSLAELCCPRNTYQDYLRRYEEKDGRFFGEMKKKVAEDISLLLKPIQDRYREISADQVVDVLNSGSRRVRPLAASVLESMRAAIGMRMG